MVIQVGIWPCHSSAQPAEDRPPDLLWPVIAHQPVRLGAQLKASQHPWHLDPSPRDEPSEGIRLRIQRIIAGARSRELNIPHRAIERCVRKTGFAPFPRALTILFDKRRGIGGIQGKRWPHADAVPEGQM